MKKIESYKFKHYLSHPIDYPEQEDLLKITTSDQFSVQVASALFLVNNELKTVKPLEIGVDQNHRRKGIATKIYMLAEEISGFKMIESDDASEDAIMFWNQKNRPFG